MTTQAAEPTPKPGTAPAATAPAPSEPVKAPAGEPAPAGTSSKLFPHRDPESGAPLDEPPPAPSAPAVPTPPTAPAAPAATPPAGKKSVTLELDDQGNILNFDAVGDLRVPIKVDGKESVETLHGLRRGYQLDSHLNQKGQRIGEQLAALKSLEQDLIARVDAANNDPKVKSDDPAVKELARQLEEVQKKLKAAPTVVTPPAQPPTPEQNREANIRMIRQAVEARGHTDFDRFFPQVESHILGLPPEQQRRYTAVDAWVTEFIDIKAKSLMANPSTPANPGNPPIGPSVTFVEPGGGGGGPAQTPSETWQRRYDAQLKIARELSQDPVKSVEAMKAWVELDQIASERPAAS
jgi:hypothetical protein